MRPRVSLCMIVRNEEANLGQCLAQAADLVDEIVIVDTGSTDRTKAIAASFGARIHDFSWRDDFSAARNESLRHASGQWIFWLDADDRIDECERKKLAALFGGLKDLDPGLCIAFAMECRSINGDGSMATEDSTTHLRLFSNNHTIAWKGRVHEAPQLIDAARPVETRQTDIVIRHIGYDDPLLVRRKANRDLRLMQIEYATRPDNANTLFFLGRVKLVMGRPQEALGLLRRSLRRCADLYPVCARKAPALEARCLMQLGRLPEALRAVEDGLARYPDDSELLFHRGCLLSARGDAAGAEACFLRLLGTSSGDHMKCGVALGLHGARTRCMLGRLYLQTGRLAEAEQQLRAVVAEQPVHVETWVLLGHIYVAERQFSGLEAVLQRLSSLPRGRALAMGLRAQLCIAQRRYTEARRLLEGAARLEPEVSWLQLALADALYLEGADWSRCLEFHEELSKTYPQNPVIQQRLQQMAQQRVGRQTLERPAAPPRASGQGILVTT
jgi:tetratricopeptide (TPR) repeat protein